MEREMRKRGPLCITEEDRILLPSTPGVIISPTPPFPEMSWRDGIVRVVMMEKHSDSHIQSYLADPSLPKQSKATLITLNAYISYRT